MKQISIHCFVMLLLFIITATTSNSFAQILSFTGAADGSLNHVAANASGTGLSRVNGAKTYSSSCGTNFCSNNFSATKNFSSTLSAEEVHVTPNQGYSLNVTGFTTNYNISSSGPTLIRFAYSTDGGTTWISQTSNNSARTGPCGKYYTLSWSTSVAINSPKTLIFRVYSFGTKKSSGTKQVANLTINGTVSPIQTSCGLTTGLSATNITSSSATLNWTAVSGATSYNIHYRVSGTSTWTNTTSATSSVNISGLTVSTGYEFQVQTVCSGGITSAYSSSATFTTVALPCSVPAGLSSSNITSSSATLSWTAVSGATSYNIHYRVSGTSTWTNTTSATSSKNISGLTASTGYEFQVQTVCSGGTTSAYSSSATFTTAAANTVPTPDHVVILILENHGYNQIIGSSAAPHINALANDAASALFTQSFALRHPSQGNYLDLYSGSNQGVTNDNVPTGTVQGDCSTIGTGAFTTANLGKQLIGKSLSWATYSEDLPCTGFNGATSNNYARKHNPAANWQGSGTNQIPSSTNKPFSSFPTDFTQLPTVCYVVPNQNNDMHNGSDPSRITTADNWMFNNLNNYIQWAKTHNSLFILTFDEDEGSEGNRITTIFTGSMVAKGQYSNTINHYNVLRTIEDMYRLGYAGQASTVTTITNCWKTASFASNVSSSTYINKMNVTAYPNPANTSINFKLDKLPTSGIRVSIYDLTGRLQGQYEFVNSLNLSVNTSHLSAGNYYYSMIEDKTVLHSGMFTVSR